MKAHAKQDNGECLKSIMNVEYFTYSRLWQKKKGSAAQVTQEIIVCIFKLHTWNFFYSFEI